MDGTEGLPVLISSDTTDEEMFVELEPDELNSDGPHRDLFPTQCDARVDETTSVESEIDTTDKNCCSVVISSSTSSTTVHGDDEIVTVSSTVCDVETDETVTVFSGAENVETELTQIATSGDGTHLHSAGHVVSHVQSLPAVTGLEGVDGQAMAMSVTCSCSVPDNTIANVESSSVNHSETVAVCDRNKKDNVTNITLKPHTSASCTGSCDANLIDILQAKSVNLQKLSMYTGLKDVHIRLCPKDVSCTVNNAAVQKKGSECFAVSSTAAADSVPGDTIILSIASEAASLLPSLEASHISSEDSVTTIAQYTVMSTKELSDVDRIPVIGDVTAVDDHSLVADSSVVAALNESEVFGGSGNIGSDGFRVSKVSEAESLCTAGWKRSHASNSVESSSAKQQKMEDSSFFVTYDDVCFNTSQQSMDTNAASSNLVVMNADVKYQQDLTCMVTDSDFTLPEVVTSAEQLDVNGASCSNDSVANAMSANGTQLVPDSLARTTVNRTSELQTDSNSQYYQQLMSANSEGIQIPACSSTEFGEVHVYVTTSVTTPHLVAEQLDVGQISYTDDAVALAIADAMTANVSPLPPDDLPMTAANTSEELNADSGLEYQPMLASTNPENISVPVDGYGSIAADEVHACVTASVSPLPPDDLPVTAANISEELNADSGLEYQQMLASANSESISVPVDGYGGIAADEVHACVTANVSPLPPDNLPMTAANISEELNADSGLEYQQMLASADSESISVPVDGYGSIAADEVHACVTSCDTGPHPVTLSASVSVDSVPDLYNKLGTNAERNAEIFNVGAVTHMSSDIAGASREMMLPPPPSVMNAGSKMRMRMEAANKEKLPALTILNRLSQNQKTKTVTFDAQETTVSSSDAEQSKAPRDFESNISADESIVFSDDKSEPSGQEHMFQEQIESISEKKVELSVDWRPPPSRTVTQHLPATVSSVLDWKPIPGWQPAVQSTSNDIDLRKQAIDFQQPLPVMSSPSPNVSPCSTLLPAAGPSVMVPDTNQPPPLMGLGPPAAVLPPLPVQPAVVPPPAVNCQVPPLMVVAAGVPSGEPTIPVAVLPPVTGAHVHAPITPPVVLPDIHQPPPSVNQTPPPVLPVTQPHAAGQHPVQPSPPGIVPPVMPALELAQNEKRHPPLLEHVPPLLGRGPLLLGDGPDNVTYTPNHPPPPGVGLRPLPSPQLVPPVHHRSPQIPPHHPPRPVMPPGPGHPLPRWGQVPPPYAAPPMWGPPPPGVPPLGYNQPYTGPHNQAFPPEWQPPPGAPYMHPGMPGPNWRPPMDCMPPDAGWWAPPAACEQQWGPPYGHPPDWSTYFAPPETSTMSEYGYRGYSAKTGDSETDALADAARGWAEWQQRYAEWYYKYYGSALPAANVSLTSEATVTTKSSVTASASSYSAKRVPKSSTSTIPLPAKLSQPAAVKPSTADTFAKFVKSAASNMNVTLGISSSKPPQSITTQSVSLSSNLSSTSAKHSQGECFYYHIS